MLCKGAIVNVYVEGSKKLMMCKKDIEVKRVKNVSMNDVLSKKCTIEVDTRTIISHHSTLFEDLIYTRLDYSFYIRYKGILHYYPKDTPILIVKNVNHNLSWLEKTLPEPIFMYLGGRIYLFSGDKGYSLIIPYVDKSLKVSDLKDGNGYVTNNNRPYNWIIVIPQIDPNEPLWKHPGCIITANQPINYHDIKFIFD